MKIEVNIQKKYFFALFGLFLVLGVVSIAIASHNSGTPNPGHDVNEIGGIPSCSSGEVLTHDSSGLRCVTDQSGGGTGGGSGVTLSNEVTCVDGNTCNLGSTSEWDGCFLSTNSIAAAGSGDTFGGAGCSIGQSGGSWQLTASTIREGITCRARCVKSDSGSGALTMSCQNFVETVNSPFNPRTRILNCLAGQGAVSGSCLGIDETDGNVVPSTLALSSGSATCWYSSDATVATTTVRCCGVS